MTKAEEVVVVDQHDRALGTMEKQSAHEQGVLHRAFSVFVFNSKNELLLHQRAAEKYHSGGLWTNTCCSHPRLGESAQQGAQRRLREEMGMSCSLEPMFDFIYNAKLDNGLTEHEFDHVFFGISDTIPTPDPTEVMDWRYQALDSISEEMSAHPERFTVWFRIAFDRVKAHLFAR